MSDEILRAYLLVIDHTQTTLKEALRKIDGIREVENWQIILPDAAVLISRVSLGDLDDRLRIILANQRYIVTLLEPGKKTGWLTKPSWQFMNEPASVFEK